MAALDRMVTVERRDPAARNALNEPVGAWLNVGRVYASVRPDGGAEVEAAASARAVGVWQVRARANDLTRSITTNDRLVWGGQAHAVQDAMAVSDGRALMEWRCVRLTD